MQIRNPNPTLRDLWERACAEAESDAAAGQRRHYKRRARQLRAFLREPRRSELNASGLWLITMCVRAMEATR